MGSRVLIVFGCFVLSVACDSHGPAAPTEIVVPATPRPTGPSGPASNPLVAPGTLVQGIINGTYPVCFPNWDATGHCRQYDFVAATDGLLVATLTWAGPSRALYDPEVFLMSPDGGWEYARDAWPEKHVTIRARSGVTYQVVVLSYGESDLSFGLVVDVQP